jgi:CRP-like cAMP-binding protein
MPTPLNPSIDRLLSLLPPSATMAEFNKKDTIFEPRVISDILYLVSKGSVKLVRIDEGGKQTIVDFCFPGDVFGEECLIQNQRIYKAVALQNCKLIWWMYNDVTRAIRNKPELGMALTRVFVKRIIERNRRIFSLCSHVLGDRLIDALRDLGNRIGEKTEEGVEIRYFIQKDLASYIGASRIEVNLQMNSLRQAGYLTYSRRERRIILKNLKNSFFEKWGGV